MFSISTSSTSPTGRSRRSCNLGRVGRWASRRSSEVLRDVSTPGLLELATCLGPQVLFQHFVLEGIQSCLEDRRSGPFPCPLHCVVLNNIAPRMNTFAASFWWHTHTISKPCMAIETCNWQAGLATCNYRVILCHIVSYWVILSNIVNMDVILYNAPATAQYYQYDTILHSTNQYYIYKITILLSIT